MGVAQLLEGFMAHYGYIALFVLMALETAMIIHFVPSELIVTIAAASLAHSPWSLGAVVAVATAGATVGSLGLYWAALRGGRPFLLRYPRLFHIRADRLERMEKLFQRPAGEAMVFLLRLLPFVRAFVSIPAGLARMPAVKFTAYSAAGAAIFNFVLAYSAYQAGKPGSGIARAIAGLGRSVTSHLAVLVPIGLLLSAAGLLAFFAWLHRAKLREEPHHMILRAWQRVTIGILATGAVLVLLALAFPGPVAGILGWLAQDLLRAGELEGRPGPGTALLFALEVVGLGFLLLALRPIVRAYGRRLRERWRKP